jgi:Protein of unknown function (DUF2817)
MHSDEPKKDWQADGYSEARANFLRACQSADASVSSYKHPLNGPQGEKLATDVALFGPHDAGKLLIMVSGVHGVEGFSGSATQVGWIEQQHYRSLPHDTAVLMIHLINPWGAAHLRRYNEDNVDLCRNFMDFSQALPGNNEYATIADELRLGSSLGAQGQYSGKYLGQKVAQHGIDYVVDLFMGGQYDYPKGFGFGGDKAVWSNITLKNILEAHNRHARRVCVIEYHTGLGPWAYGTLITMHSGAELERIRQCFGPWTFNPSWDKKPGEDGYRIVHGHTSVCYKASFHQAEVSAVTLEFGTYPPDETLALLVQEHLLIQQADEVDPAVMQDIKARLLEYHHPADWEWRWAFWSRSLQVTRQALNALAN